MATKDFIVAIELGSSKVTGIAGRKNLDGSITILALAQEPSSSFIRKGVVYNIDQTAQCLANIVKKLENALKTKIMMVYVGVGGQSLRSVKNILIENLSEGERVTVNMVDNLTDRNRDTKYANQEIIDVALQEYKVDSQYQINPIGIECHTLEANFLNILSRDSVYTKLNKCFQLAKVNVEEMYDAPLALADCTLSEAEKRSGCALIDFGADTTTVSVYYKNILRHLAVIPLGSNNITKDITCLKMEEEEAEKMKLKYGCAYTENIDIDNTLKYPIDTERDVESRIFIDIVESRTTEIIENVTNQIELSGYINNLLGGIIITGGGSNMKNLDVALRKHTNIEKIRIAKTILSHVNSSANEIKANDGRMNTILGLLIKGDRNCAGDEINENADLFTDDTPKTTVPYTTPDIKQPRQGSDLTTGVVRTEAEKQKAEEERRKSQEEEDRRKKAEDEENRKKEAEEKRKNQKPNALQRMASKAKGWMKTLVEEEDE